MIMVHGDGCGNDGDSDGDHSCSDCHDDGGDDQKYGDEMKLFSNEYNITFSINVIFDHQ